MTRKTYAKDLLADDYEMVKPIEVKGLKPGVHMCKLKEGDIGKFVSQMSSFVKTGKNAKNDTAFANFITYHRGRLLALGLCDKDGNLFYTEPGGDVQIVENFPHQIVKAAYQKLCEFNDCEHLVFMGKELEDSEEDEGNE